jgi:hypothetical protein
MRKLCIVIGLSFFFCIGIVAQTSAQKTHCWDLNEDYDCDIGGPDNEDINEDGKCNAKDCQEEGDLPVIIWSGGCSIPAVGVARDGYIIAPIVWTSIRPRTICRLNPMEHSLPKCPVFIE